MGLNKIISYCNISSYKWYYFSLNDVIEIYIPNILCAVKNKSQVAKTKTHFFVSISFKTENWNYNMWYLVGQYPTRKVWIRGLGDGEVEFWFRR